MDREKLLDKPIKVGPWGGPGGSKWDMKVSICIKQIIVRHGWAIDSLVFKHGSNGSQQRSIKFGGDGGRTDKVCLDWPDERLASISGYYGVFGGQKIELVRSLTFISNCAKYGPFGKQEGTPFSLPVSDGMIVGFHGRCGQYLDALGVYLRPITSVPVTGNYFVSCDRLPTMKALQINEFACGVVKEPVPIGPGPWGGEGGKPWDDGVYSGIKRVCIMWGGIINSIKIEYDRSGQSVWSSRHGGTGETTHRLMIEFDYPDEVLKCISGYYVINGDERPTLIKSLTFHTTMRRYGPFGEEIGMYFTSTTTEGKVVGFHGRSALYLDAIGVHMQHWLDDNQSSTKSF